MRRALHKPIKPLGECLDVDALVGLEEAINFARNGQFIFAIKHLEALNPTLTREKAIRLATVLGTIHRAFAEEEDYSRARCL